MEVLRDEQMQKLRTVDYCPSHRLRCFGLRLTPPNAADDCLSELLQRAEVSDEAGGQRIGREALRRALWAFDGRADTTALSTAILERFEWDPAKIVCFAARATPADYAEFAPLVLEYASAKDPLAVAIIQEAANAATSIIQRLKDVGCPAISLIGGLAEPLTEWLPSHVQGLLSAPQSDPLDGAILMARRAFFRLESLTLRAG